MTGAVGGSEIGMSGGPSRNAFDVLPDDVLVSILTLMFTVNNVGFNGSQKVEYGWSR